MLVLMLLSFFWQNVGLRCWDTGQVLIWLFIDRAKGEVHIKHTEKEQGNIYLEQTSFWESQGF